MAKGQRFTDAEIAAILKERKPGVTAQEIADKHGIHPTTLSKWARNHREPLVKKTSTRRIKRKPQASTNTGATHEVNRLWKIIEALLER